MPSVEEISEIVSDRSEEKRLVILVKSRCKVLLDEGSLENEAWSV
jgi:hypothetical protein